MSPPSLKVVPISYKTRFICSIYTTSVFVVAKLMQKVIKEYACDCFSMSTTTTSMCMSP